VQLPPQPGTLIKLRVFSILRNKLRRLPSYLSEFHELSIFKISQNPIEWPPKSVLETSDNLDDPQNMAGWIHRVQEWISENNIDHVILKP